MAPEYNLNHVAKHYPFMTCLVKVNPHYNWQKIVAEVLNKCHGVYSFRMDENGVVEISGTVDPILLLKKLGKAGRKAELRWFQFGECSSNLFMPANYSGFGGASYSRDGRYLQAGNLPRPKLPSHEAPMSSSHNPKHDYQTVYDQKHGHDQYAHNHNYHYRQPYDHKHGYHQGYYHDRGYQHSYDRRNGYGHDYQYNSGYRHDGNQTHHRASLPNLGGEEIACCRVM